MGNRFSGKCSARCRSTGDGSRGSPSHARSKGLFTKWFWRSRRTVPVDRRAFPRGSGSFPSWIED